MIAVRADAGKVKFLWTVVGCHLFKKSKSENNFSYKNKSKIQFIVLNKYRKEGYILKDKTVNDNVSRLAHLLNQKYMNISLYESKKIPAYMYEQVNEELCKKIDELEKACYTCT